MRTSKLEIYKLFFAYLEKNSIISLAFKVYCKQQSLFVDLLYLESQLGVN